MKKVSTICLVFLFIVAALPATAFVDFKQFQKKKINKEELALCDDIVAGEIVVKVKDLRIAHREAIEAPRHFRQLIHKKESRAQVKLRTALEKKAEISRFEPVFDFEKLHSLMGDEVTTSSMMTQRRLQLKRTSLRHNLEDFYLVKVNPIEEFQFFKKEKDSNHLCLKTFELMKELSKNPNIEYAEPNFKYGFADNHDMHPEDFMQEAQLASQLHDWHYDYDALWGLEKIHADFAWQKSEGDDTIIAVVDSGVNYNHKDLWDNIWVNPGLIPDRNRDGKVTLDDADTNHNHRIDRSEILRGMIGTDVINLDSDPMDSLGHGTHVAGLIAAVRGNNEGIIGVSPHAKILPIRVFDGAGRTTTRAIAEGILYAAMSGADVINLSLGGPQHSKIIKEACDSAAKTSFLVAAAGNENKDLTGTTRKNSFYPAAYDSTFSVSSITEKDSKARSSSYGAKVDLAAPGGASARAPNILSTDLTASGYRLRSGTSMATPFVAGAAALLLAQDHHLKPMDLKNILRFTSTKIENGFDIGSGIVNAEEALEDHQNLPHVKLKLSKQQEFKAKKIQHAFAIRGYVVGNDIAKYEIFIGPGSSPEEWKMIHSENTNFSINGVLDKSYDTSHLKNGIYTVKLVAYNRRGESSFDKRLIYVTN